MPPGIRLIDQTLGDASPNDVEQGVPIQRNKSGPKGFLSILMTPRNEPNKLLPETLNDNIIINQLLEVRARRTDLDVVLVTKDINMRLKRAPVALRPRITAPTSWSTTCPCCPRATIRSPVRSGTVSARSIPARSAAAPGIGCR